jgi:glc operon protein GlcG
MALTLDFALALLARARAECERRKISMSFAIVDIHGNVVAVQRMDGQAFMAPVWAQSKAFTAAATRMSTTKLAEALAGNPDGLASFVASAAFTSGGRFMASRGGMPIVQDGEIIGGFGTSGAGGVEDQAIAEFAVSAPS